MELVEPLLFFLLECDGLLEFTLSKSRLNVLDSSQVHLSSLKVVGDGPVDTPEQQLEGLDLNVEKMEAEHGNQIVGETLEIDFIALENFLSSHIVVREEVDAKSLLV